MAVYSIVSSRENIHEVGKNDVTVRFGLGSIGEEVYNITSKHLEVQLSQIEDEIAALQKQNSTAAASPATMPAIRQYPSARTAGRT